MDSVLAIRKGLTTGEPAADVVLAGANADTDGTAAGKEVLKSVSE